MNKNHPQPGHPRKRLISISLIRLILGTPPKFRDLMIRTMLQNKTKKLLFIIVVALSSCSVTRSTNEPGVIFKTDKARYVGGNSLHFQQRHEAKMKRQLQVTKN